VAGWKANYAHAGSLVLVAKLAVGIAEARWSWVSTRNVSSADGCGVAVVGARRGVLIVNPL